jgi:hypothetical protein
VTGDREEVGKEPTINIAPRSSSCAPVLQTYGVVEFTLNGVRGATALGTADARLGS